MKTPTPFLCLALVLAAGSAGAQAPASRPAAKPAATKTSAPKPVTAAKPAAAKVTPAARPAAKPAARPAASASKATSAPAPAPTPAAAPTKAPTKAASTTSAGGELFRKGTLMANLGVGLGLGYSGYYGTLKSTPAMSLSVEKGIIEGVGPGTIGVGGLVGYKSYHYNYGSGNYKATWTNLLISVRGTYHYNILENPKLDTYGGISIGVRVQKWKDTYFDNTPYLSGYASSSSYVTSGIFVGARYFLTNNIGAFTEVGYDMNYLKLGLTAKF